MVFKCLAKAHACLWTWLKGRCGRSSIYSVHVSCSGCVKSKSWGHLLCLLSVPMWVRAKARSAHCTASAASTADIGIPTAKAQGFLSPGVPPRTSLKLKCLSKSYLKADRMVEDWPNLVSSATPGARPPKLLNSIYNLQFILWRAQI